MNAGSAQKWLVTHAGIHFHAFYLPEGVALQQRFFDHFLRGVDNGWDAEPPVQLLIRRPGSARRRGEGGWPIPQTCWTEAALTVDGGLLLDGSRQPGAPGELAFDADAGSLDFVTPTMDADVGRSTPTTRSRSWPRARSTGSTSRCSRRASSPRPATGSS